MKRLSWACLTVLLSGAALGQGWTEPRRIGKPDSLADMSPCVATDGSGVPWVVWEGPGRVGPDSQLAYTMWLGDSWAAERGVGPKAPGVIARGRATLAFEDGRKAWLVWCNKRADNSTDIGSSFWADTCWSPEIQVNEPDSTELDFAPKVACGGGQVWCVWYGGPTSMSNYAIFASRWNGPVEQWSPEMRVSPADGRHHWWCDVAVDRSGTPHVVWCTHPLYTVFHSYYDGDSWSTPVPVNDPTQFTASPWADPRIVIDREGILHVSFTGARVGALYRDILYTRNDGTGWQPCQMVTRDSVYHEWYSDIAADRPDNVWVVWDRQNEGPDQFRVYASHYDGVEWWPEERLDNDATSRDGGVKVAMDSSALPWAVWFAPPYSGGANLDIFHSRYGSGGILSHPVSLRPARALLRPASCPATWPVEVVYFVPAAGQVRLDVLDVLGRVVATLQEGWRGAGPHTAVWREPKPSGLYLLRLQAEGVVDVRRVVLVCRD